MSFFSTKVSLGAVSAVAMFATAAQADDLILIDLTVPNQISMTATSGLSAVSASGSDFTGIYFENFYGTTGGVALDETLISGDLTSAAQPANNEPDLFRSDAGSDPGLNMFSWTTFTMATFTTGSQAFTGSATWSLSSAEYTDMINGNTSGDIYFPADSDDDIAGLVALGTYRVIPTPGALPLLGLGFGVATIRRRR